MKLTYKEYSELSILHETLRNLASVLYSQKNWLDSHLNDPDSFVKNFPEFEELVRQESALLGKEGHLLESLELDSRSVEKGFKRNFTYCLIGYGSLMNADEVIGELKDTLKSAGVRVKDINAEFKARVTPVWVVGYKRVFNKIATRRKWETEEDVKANKQAVLNVAASLRSKFNAVAIKLTDDEMDAIRKREKNYGVIALKHVYDYRSGQRLDEQCVCVKSNILSVDVPVDKKERRKFYYERLRKYAYGMDPTVLVKTNRMPIPRYIEVIDAGVRKLDSMLGTVGMYDNYLETTFVYYIDRAARKDYGEVKLSGYYRLIGREIERRLRLNLV